jgi:membrane protease YdiL (CAAX protease family)
MGIAGVGLLFLCNWYTRLNGIESLSSVPTRRNNMPFFLPFLAMLLWLMLTAAMSPVAGFIAQGKDEWVEEFISYVFVSIVSIAMLICFFLAANRYFVRGLKGFGLDRRTIGRDIGAAFVNYITVMPLILVGLWTVMIVGTLMFGDDFQMTQHESLSVMSGESPLLLKIAAVMLAVIIAPVFEEVLFRGLFQSSIVSITSRPWFSIAVTSLFFVMLHPPKHWPALFALSMCMGYTYERSGSLYRAIFLHMIFNTISTAAALLSS